MARAGATPAAGTDLAAHLEACPTCAEATALAAAFRTERDAACAEARPTPAGLVWWKAELRGRYEQARAASRPILIAHTIALAALLAATLALASWLAPQADVLLRDLSVAWPRPSLVLPLPPLDLATMARPGILLAAAAALVLGPLALYLAVSRD